MDGVHVELGGRESGSCELDLRASRDIRGCSCRDGQFGRLLRLVLGVGERLGDRLGAHVDRMERCPSRAVGTSRRSARSVVRVERRLVV
jgi:hypothetical protein